MPDADNQFAELATGLNEDSKAARRKTVRDEPKPVAEPSDDEQLAADADALKGAIDEGEEGRMADFEPEHPAAVSIERSAEEFIPNVSDAVQGLRDFVLGQVKALDQPWFKIPEAQQHDIAKSIEYACEEALRKVVEEIAARGQQPVRILLKKMSAGEKIQISGEAVLIGPDDPDKALLMLHHAIGKHVMLTRATVDDYRNGPEPETDKDEPEIDFESEDLLDDDFEADEDELAQQADRPGHAFDD